MQTMIIIKQVTINQMATVATHSAPSFTGAGSVLAVDRSRIKSLAFPVRGFFEVVALNAGVPLESMRPAVGSPRGPLGFFGCCWLPGLRR